ncbi:uncharacterized protein PRCAT00000016001 [Priceomyces carsonii]|uniref:uncharacterized protein n=1 Tax=Priceomyces carsonii TaxID=28549 RepID=UPI002EDB4DBB|nr:unnamed protein product [Priceomyces carsonii]
MTTDNLAEKVVLKFVIIGAGLGGLAAAIGLRLNGHEVVILEQALKLGEVGAGIQIPPNSTRILERYGCKKQILELSTLPKACRFYKWDHGNELSSQNLWPYCVQKYGGEYLHIHRADFHRVLVDRAKELGVSIILNSTVVDLDFNTNKVFTSDNREYTGDIIIGADGLRSKVRSLMLGREDPPHDTGDLAYRALVRVEDMKEYPELDFISKEPNIHFWWGPDIHVVVYLLHGGKTCNIVVLSPDTLDKNTNVMKAGPNELKELFSKWDPRLQKLISLVHQTSKWKLQNSVEMDTWVHPSANVALMGDACHATLPYLAQGAAQAVEDSACLSEIFGASLVDRGQIHYLLKLYENLRKERTTRIVLESTNCRNIYHLHDGPKQMERDRLCALFPPQEGCPNRWADPVFQKFLFSTDIFEEAKAATKSYKNGNKILV